MRLLHHQLKVVRNAWSWNFRLSAHNVSLVTSCRNHSSVKTAEKCSVNVSSNTVTIRSAGWPRALQLNSLWLRDHCRCGECFNHTTNQRATATLPTAESAAVKESSVSDGGSGSSVNADDGDGGGGGSSVNEDDGGGNAGENLSVVWQDGHRSQWPLDWLWNNVYDGALLGDGGDGKHDELFGSDTILWDRARIAAAPYARVAFKDYMSADNDDAGLKSVVWSMKKFGFALVERTPVSIDATESVSRRICHVQQTLFGGMWTFSNVQMTHADTAYTPLALGAHNDGTYYGAEASGVQVFHCLEHDGAGGETLLVDGFNAVRELKRQDEKSFQLLSTTNFESEYKEEGHHLINSGPIIRTEPVSGKVIQVRFNLYDRGPMRSIPQHAIPAFYGSLTQLQRIVAHADSELRIKLRPGTVLLFNNWRVLHGRSSYTGQRTVCGCYLPFSDFDSKMRMLCGKGVVT